MTDTNTTGSDYLKAQLPRLPTTPGVYRMLNAHGDILYVGKAKNIKNRVTQYTRDQALSRRIAQMVFHTRELIVVETSTEAEALLLEIQLIKSLKPKYNILFRDDTSYLRIVMTDEEVPQIRSYRGKAKPKGQVFGPYPNGDAVYQTIDLLERIFKLRTCKPSQFANRTRPCLKYDIKRCSAPCVGKISVADYQDNVKAAAGFLHGETQTVQTNITQKMQHAAAVEEFELAATYRDQLASLSALTNTKQGLAADMTHTDVIALTTAPNPAGNLLACVQIFHYRNGQSFGNSVRYQILPADTSDAEALTTFLLQHYTNHTPAKELLITPKLDDMDAIATALTTAAPYKVRISSPSRGEKHLQLQQATRNASSSLQRRLAETANWSAQMTAFGAHLQLTAAPTRIECFDVSNTSGKNAVTSMVTADSEGMQPKQYRLFNASTDTPNDYAMMAETLTRRYSKLKKAAETIQPDATSPFPSIVLVDGGIGHLNTAVQVFEDLDLFELTGCPVLTAIAKGEERDKGLEKIYVYRPASKQIEQLPIPHDTPLIFMLQNVRDEAHRFAIGAHRKQRSKTRTQSALDDLPKVGPKRKKALLLHFGSAAEVKSAPPSELMKVSGISKALAEEIHGWFNG